MGINTYVAPLYLADNVEELVELKYSQNSKIRPILEEFKRDLEIIHTFTRKLSDFENGKINSTQLTEAYNQYKSDKSMNLMGGICE